MRISTLTALAVLSVACASGKSTLDSGNADGADAGASDGGDSDGGASDGGDSDGGGDGGGDGGASECNDANEDCAPIECDGEGSRMLPGADCLACHTPGNLWDDKKKAARAKGDDGEWEDDPDKMWALGGTAFMDLMGSAPADGAIVRITDANGDVITLTTNSVGNFYTTQEPVWPVTPSIEYDGQTISMPFPIDYGGCNSCHQCDGAAGGKLYVP